MVWSKEKIITRIEEILARMQVETNIDEIKKLKMDYIRFLCILKTIDTTLYEKYKERCEPIDSYFELHDSFSHIFNKDSYDNLLKERKRFTEFYRLSQSIRLSRTKLLYESKIDEDSYIKIVENFFKGFDSEMYKLFLRLLNGNINLAKNPKFTQIGARGTCYFDRLNHDAFVTANFRNMKDGTILPHEVAHAHQMLSFEDDDLVLKYHLSSYCEMLPKLIELLFVHHNSKGKYRNALIEQERIIYDEFIVMMEGYSNKIFHLEDYNMKNGTILTSSGIMPKPILNDILSRTLAIYFYYMYLENENEFNRLLNLFNNNLVRVTDSELTNMFDEEEIIYGVRKVLGKFPNHK